MMFRKVLIPFVVLPLIAFMFFFGYTGIASAHSYSSSHVQQAQDGVLGSFTTNNGNVQVVLEEQVANGVVYFNTFTLDGSSRSLEAYVSSDGTSTVQQYGVNIITGRVSIANDGIIDFCGGTTGSGGEYKCQVVD